MKISEQLLCLFSAQVEQREGSYLVEVPEQELQLGDLQEGETYRIAVFPNKSEATSDERKPDQERSSSGPPVEKGELREVEIEEIGEQGDGIARVERGYVLIIPDTETGERVTAEITDVRSNVAFAEVVTSQTHF